MTMVDQRPAEAADRTVSGHWEGDLITGAANRSAIGTLVERVSRFTILLHLPSGRHTAEDLRDALVAAMGQLPAELRRSLTGTRAASWRYTPRSRRPWACRCTSASRTHPGSDPPMRTL